jgi:predicted O-methyltransferase YrrM
LTDEVYEYLLRVSLREPDVLARLREETQAFAPNDARMQVSPEQAQFMALLIELIGARRVLELGTFTGYSALRMALALPPDGRLVTCDVDDGWTAVARRYWRDAGVAHKIDLRLGRALGTIDTLLSAGAADSFDFAFIDADKQEYGAYYERCLRLVRPGGLVAVDNVLWSGQVVDAATTDADTRALQELNAALCADQRISMSLLPIGDGLTLARKH